MKKRIWELGKEFNIKSKKILELAQKNNIKVNSVLNCLEESDLKKLKVLIKEKFPSDRKTLAKDQEAKHFQKDRIHADKTAAREKHLDKASKDYAQLDRGDSSDKGKSQRIAGVNKNKVDNKERITKPQIHKNIKDKRVDESDRNRNRNHFVSRGKEKYSKQKWDKKGTFDRKKGKFDPQQNSVKAVDSQKTYSKDTYSKDTPNKYKDHRDKHKDSKDRPKEEHHKFRDDRYKPKDVHNKDRLKENRYKPKNEQDRSVTREVRTESKDKDRTKHFGHERHSNSFKPKGRNDYRNHSYSKYNNQRFVKSKFRKNRRNQESSSKDRTLKQTNIIRPIEVPIPITVKNFSQIVGIRSNVIIKSLVKNYDTEINLNHTLDEAMVEMIGMEFNKKLKIKKEENKEEMLLKELEKKDAPDSLVVRDPVVTFLGHVDHGKTSLLDCIRKSDVAGQEAGGITQHIGAYKIKSNNHGIVFLDTPGHEAFTAMRARGAQVTDIVVLVVAADDGVMPQTVEAISHAKAAKVPIIVAINKIDKSNARPDAVLQQLARHGLMPEEWHGDTICVKVSAHTKDGIPELLEYILLVAEMQELKANPKRKASGTVIEARFKEGKGGVATLLIQNGTLKTGHTILCGNHCGRIRDIISHNGEKLKKAGPSTPVEISGLSGLPLAGDKFYVTDSFSQAKDTAALRKKEVREKRLTRRHKAISAEEILKKLQRGQTKELQIILKTDVHGTSEAITAKLEQLSHKEIEIKIVHSGVGSINDTDIQLAIASEALVIGFNVNAAKSTRDMAEDKNVEIRRYTVIYHLIEDIQSIMEGMLPPKITEKVIGHCTIRKVIKISKVGNIAGCYVTDGIIERNARFRLYRNGVMVNKEKPLELSSLKRFKEDTGQVKEGYECGLKIDGYNDIKEGDELEAFKMQEEKRTL